MLGPNDTVDRVTLGKTQGKGTLPLPGWIPSKDTSTGPHRRILEPLGLVWGHLGLFWGRFGAKLTNEHTPRAPNGGQQDP